MTWANAVISCEDICKEMEEWHSSNKRKENKDIIMNRLDFTRIEIRSAK